MPLAESYRSGESGRAVPYPDALRGCIAVAWKRRKTLGRWVVGAGAGLLIAAATAPVVAGGTAVAAAEPAGCSATARIDSQWGTGTSGGQIVTVTITNTASTTATRWTASWTLASGQSVASAWNATVTTSGTTVTAVNAAYNGSLAPGASTSFGMQLSGVASAPVLSCANDASVPVSPSASQSSGADVTVTEADNLTTITVFVGQSVGISLGPDFRPTTVSGPALVLASTSGGYPTGQPLVELYRAHDAGSVDVSTTTDFACLHTTPRCARPITLWRVHINVVGVGG
jgi:cellulose binding protein with CBM2 domain